MRTIPIRATLGSSWREIATRPRLLLAAKAAVAASAAWLLVPLVPFADAKYEYYAPVGVVISMYPTLARSAWSGLQTLIGLAIGIAVGLGLGIEMLILGVPSVVVVGVVAGVGMLLGALRVLGVGRDWIAITALFVLLVGGGGADDYSLSYLINLGFGMAIGVAVNLLVFPPLSLRKASERLSTLRDMVAGHLRDLADAFTHGAQGSEQLDVAMDRLVATADAVRTEVREANESGKGNPRGRGHRGQDEENYGRMRALERTIFFVRDLADVLATLEHVETVADPSADDFSALARRDLATAIERTADLVATPKGSEGSEDRLIAADNAVELLVHSLDEHAAGQPSAVANDLAATVALRRIIEASRPFVE